MNNVLERSLISFKRQWHCKTDPHFANAVSRCGIDPKVKNEKSNYIVLPLWPQMFDIERPAITLNIIYFCNVWVVLFLGNKKRNGKGF